MDEQDNLAPDAYRPGRVTDGDTEGHARRRIDETDTEGHLPRTRVSDDDEPVGQRHAARPGRVDPDDADVDGHARKFK